MRLFLRKASFAIGILALLHAAPASATSGEALLVDSFDSSNLVDLHATTAYVDTTGGWMELDRQPLANAIAASADDSGNVQDVVIADESGVAWFTKDQASGRLVNLASMSTTYTNPNGVSLLPQARGYYVFGQDSNGSYVRQVTIDESGGVDNPLMAASGLDHVVSVSAVSENAFAEADKSGNVTVFAYDESAHHPVKDPAHSFSTNKKDIVTVKNIPNTFDFLVVTKTGSFMYSFDQSSGGYIENPAYAATSDGRTVAADASDANNQLTLSDTGNGTVYRMDQQTSHMSGGDLFLMGSPAAPIAVSMPSDTSAVIAARDGSVSGFSYDAASNQMVQDPNLLLTGFKFKTDYESPGTYQSVNFAGGRSYNMFRITPDEQIPVGTKISYALSTDGGVNFSSVPPNQWVHLGAPADPTSTPALTSGPYVVRAILDDKQAPQSTPRLLDIKVEGYLDVTPPTAPGAPYAYQNPSYSTDTPITWTPSDDPVQPPSTDTSGISTYLFRYSTDNGATWSDWIKTNSPEPGYHLIVPENTAALYMMQVEAVDAAGNVSPPSPIGSVFIDTYPLAIVPGANQGLLTVTQILAPSEGQSDPPTDVLPVKVKAGGEVMYEVTTSGHAESVEVTYSDGQKQQLVPKYTPSDPVDKNVWTGFYYPSSQSTIPLNTPQGTRIDVGIRLSRTGSQHQEASPLLEISGTIDGNGPFISSYLAK